MHCNLFVLDSILIQIFFFIDYLHKNIKNKSILSNCNLEASMPKCTFPFTFVHVMIISLAASLAQEQYYTMVYSLFDI